MKIQTLLGVAVLFALPQITGGKAVSGSAAAFDEALTKVEAAQRELVQGRPEPFKSLWSQRDDVTLIGGLGGEIEKGWTRVSQRLDWVSKQYSEGTRAHTEVSRFVAADIAYVIQRETLRYRVPGEGREVTQELRTTMVFRLEDAQWRLVHRHADTQSTKPTGK